MLHLIDAIRSVLFVVIKELPPYSFDLIEFFFESLLPIVLSAFLVLFITRISDRKEKNYDSQKSINLAIDQSLNKMMKNHMDQCYKLHYRNYNILPLTTVPVLENGGYSLGDTKSFVSTLESMNLNNQRIDEEFLDHLEQLDSYMKLYKNSKKIKLFNELHDAHDKWTDSFNSLIYYQNDNFFINDENFITKENLDILIETIKMNNRTFRNYMKMSKTIVDMSETEFYKDLT